MASAIVTGLWETALWLAAHAPVCFFIYCGAPFVLSIAFLSLQGLKRESTFSTCCLSDSACAAKCLFCSMDMSWILLSRDEVLHWTPGFIPLHVSASFIWDFHDNTVFLRSCNVAFGLARLCCRTFNFRCSSRRPLHELAFKAGLVQLGNVEAPVLPIKVDESRVQAGRGLSHALITLLSRRMKCKGQAAQWKTISVSFMESFENSVLISPIHPLTGELLANVRSEMGPEIRRSLRVRLVRSLSPRWLDVLEPHIKVAVPCLSRESTHGLLPLRDNHNLLLTRRNGGFDVVFSVFHFLWLGSLTTTRPSYNAHSKKKHTKKNKYTTLRPDKNFLTKQLKYLTLSKLPKLNPAGSAKCNSGDGWCFMGWYFVVMNAPQLISVTITVAVITRNKFRQTDTFDFILARRKVHPQYVLYG